MNIIHMKKDGKEDEQAVEKKYRWDEENRLLASDENGFVANYWYDADGERTVKSSGEGEQVYVNCRSSREQSQACLSFAKAQPTIICDNYEFSGGVTNTAKFSLYVSPYLVASQGGKYTKHIYIGSQRIVSKLGDLASYGADPRRIPYAGTEADGVSVDYQTKYNRQQQAIKDNYADFGVPYNGEDNNDYVNGEGFCCNDGTPTVARAKAARSIEGNFKPNDDYEKMQFYYHPDHLGSSSYITNLDGEVVQHIEYVPFGEVFIEERNNTWNTPYLFNAKEYDEETGMYYYGARYFEPRISLWMSTDRFAEKYPSMSAYQYCASSPLNYIDAKGDSIIIDPYGYIIGQRGQDNVVYRQQIRNNKIEYIPIGEKGKVIHVNVIYANLLARNAKRSRSILNPFKIKELVKTNGEWDLKNDKTSIFGFANDGNTKFEFQGKSMESQDIGNHHFGVIIAANKLLPREFALKMAGSYQISSGTSRSEWQRYLEYDVISPTTGIIVHMRVMLPPYGDDPRDQNWIKAGYNYFDSILKKKMRQYLHKNMPSVYRSNDA